MSQSTMAVTLGLWLLAPGAATAESGPGGLPRRADLQVVFRAQNDHLEARKVEADSPVARAGLREGDRLLTVNGRRFRKPFEGVDLLRRIDGGASTRLQVRRKGRTVAVRFVPRAQPPEAIEGFDTELGALKTADGARLRTFVSIPAGAVGRRPAIFFVQWVACSSIEIEAGDPTTDMLMAVARAERMVVLRVERSSNGDSEGPGCHELDFDTEVAQYRAAFDRLIAHPRVDRDQVVVWGNSLGSVTAPFVVRGKTVAGLIVGGGGALHYLERMITFDRIRLEREQADPAALHLEMLRRIRFHYAYLIEGRDPKAIERKDPDLRGVWSRILGTGDGVHYGRPYAYHRQIAKKNILGEWLRIKVPVLVMYNALDQFEAEHGHRLIARTLNRRQPGQATYVRHAKMGHGQRIYPDEYAAHRWDRNQRVSGARVAARAVIDWLRSTFRTP